MNESEIVSLAFLIYFIWSLGGITATMMLHFKYDKLPSHDPGWIALIYLVSIIAGSVTDLCQFFTISNPALTRHVQVLAKAGIISGERRGREVVYCLNVKEISESLIRFAFLISKKGK